MRIDKTFFRNISQRKVLLQSKRILYVMALESVLTSAY